MGRIEYAPTKSRVSSFAIVTINDLIIDIILLIPLFLPLFITTSITQCPPFSTFPISFVKFIGSSLNITYVIYPVSRSLPLMLPFSLHLDYSPDVPILSLISYINTLTVRISLPTVNSLLSTFHSHPAASFTHPSILLYKPLLFLFTTTI